MSGLLDGALVVALVLLGVSAVLVVVRLLRGPSGLDRLVALDVLVAEFLCGLVVHAALTGDSALIPVVVAISLVGFLGSTTVARFVQRGERAVTVLDAVGTVFILVGVVLTLVASVGVLRLPDVLSRMHAATKPQVVGLLFVVIGGALHLRTSVDVWMLVLAGLFQLVTAPVTAHVVGRLAHRSGGVRSDLLHVDELAEPPTGSRGPDARP